MAAGVGQVMASEMVTRLGTSVLDVLDSPSAAAILQKCNGIGAVMAQKIKRNWDDSRGAALPSCRAIPPHADSPSCDKSLCWCWSRI